MKQILTRCKAYFTLRSNISRAKCISQIRRIYFVEKSTNLVLRLVLFSGAGNRNRTGTGVASHRILSPGRLPVPPLRQVIFRLPYYINTDSLKCQYIFYKKFASHFLSLSAHLAISSFRYARPLPFARPKP